MKSSAERVRTTTKYTEQRADRVREGAAEAAHGAATDLEEKLKRSDSE
jgi:hypothetical protein